MFTQEELAIISEKRLELKNIQQKVEKLRSSLECFDNIEGDIGSDSVVRYAKEQLMMRNQHRIIHRLAGVLVYGLMLNLLFIFFSICRSLSIQLTFLLFIQLCKLNDIVKRDNKRDVILNYHNLLFQR